MKTQTIFCIKQTTHAGNFFFFFLVSLEVNIFSMRFPLLMEIVLVFDALHRVNFQNGGPSKMVEIRRKTQSVEPNFTPVDVFRQFRRH